jgi:hypothetical protein
VEQFRRSVRHPDPVIQMKTCPRCGEPLPSLVEIAAVAARADAALHGGRHHVPQVATTEVRSVASWLRCVAGLCGGGARGPSAS